LTTKTSFGYITLKKYWLILLLIYHIWEYGGARLIWECRNNYSKTFEIRLILCTLCDIP
jgi:hypothetical protein